MLGGVDPESLETKKAAIDEHHQKVDASTQTSNTEQLFDSVQEVSNMLSIKSLPFRFIPPIKQSINASQPAQIVERVQSGDPAAIISEESVVNEGSDMGRRAAPPTIALPPPPKAPPPPIPPIPTTIKGISSLGMPPPSRIPEKKPHIPSRPLSPPPRELIQRATTPLSSWATFVSGRMSSEQAPIPLEPGNDHRSDRSLKSHDQFFHHIRHHSSSASVDNEDEA